MHRPPNNSLDILARSIHKEVRVFYDNPQNIEKFNAWKKQKHRLGRTSDLK